MKRDFEEIYKELYIKYNDLAKKSNMIQRTKSMIYIILCIVLIIVLNIGLYNNVEFPIFLVANASCISLSILIFKKIKIESKYTPIYKNNLISACIKGANSNFNYEPEKK